MRVGVICRLLHYMRWFEFCQYQFHSNLHLGKFCLYLLTLPKWNFIVFRAVGCLTDRVKEDLPIGNLLNCLKVSKNLLELRAMDLLVIICSTTNKVIVTQPHAIICRQVMSSMTILNLQEVALVSVIESTAYFGISSCVTHKVDTQIGPQAF